MTLEKLKNKQFAMITHLPDKIELTRKLIAQGVLPDMRVQEVRPVKALKLATSLLYR